MLDSIYSCMPIYTKTGDKGTASLFNNTRVSKAHIRLQTYGEIDELNSLLGVVLSELEACHSELILGSLKESNKMLKQVQQDIIEIQQDLFSIGAVLANPVAPLKSSFLSHLQERTTWFETHIDTMTARLTELKNFILPGGSKVGSLLQYARAISRRIERSAVALHEKENVSLEILKYLNRLSDLLFTMSRFVNHTEGIKEIIWKG